MRWTCALALESAGRRQGDWNFIATGTGGNDDLHRVFSGDPVYCVNQVVGRALGDCARSLRSIQGNGCDPFHYFVFNNANLHRALSLISGFLTVAQPLFCWFPLEGT